MKRAREPSRARFGTHAWIGLLARRARDAAYRPAVAAARLAEVHISRELATTCAGSGGRPVGGEGLQGGATISAADLPADVSR